jgi:hypothetical protein
MYRVIDTENDNEYFFGNKVFATKEDVRQALITSFWYDAQDNEEDIEGQTLEGILESGHLLLEEVETGRIMNKE